MASIDKVRILVVGDAGVGKTSLVNLICNNNVTNPSWTIGCSVEVKLHEYKEGFPQQKTYFVELWDIGGKTSHQNTRSIFYNPVHGIILVHDLTNRKSQQNLQKWLSEVLNKDGSVSKTNKSFDDFDPENFVGSTQIPILVIGTKLDLAGSTRAQRAITVAEECGAEEIFLNCKQAHSVAAGSSSAVKLTRFFDKVIEKKFFSRDIISPPNFGKIASQCSHAAVCCYKLAQSRIPDILNKWELAGQPKIVLRLDSGGEMELKNLAQKAAKEGLLAAIVRDAGHTQVSSGTATVLGIGPGPTTIVDKITKHLKLL